MKKWCKAIAVLLIASLSFACTGCQWLDSFVDGLNDIYKIYETTDLEKYGEYPVTRYGYEAAPHAQAVMPEKIEDFFSVREYTYKMCHEPAMHEAYLEVVIADEAQYQAYIADIIGENETKPFRHDNSFEEYVICEKIWIQPHPTVGASQIQKILFSDDTNTIIFLSLHVPHNDAPLEAEVFTYFTRFSIDISE